MFLVKGYERRLVVDNSMIANLVTTHDAYSFTNMEELLNKSSVNQFFLKTDLKSAYHQVPLK